MYPMAEQSINIAMTLKSTESDGGNSRRSSMGKESSLDGGEKILPHYLRASTGSCHDFCKYGRKHAFEEKARHPFPKRITKKPPDDRSLAKFQTEKTNTSVVKVKPSPSEIIKREVPSKSVDGKDPVFKEVLAKRVSPGLLTRSCDNQSSVLREVLVKKKSLAGSSLTKSFDSQSPVSREVLVKEKASTLKGSNKPVSQTSISSETKKETSAAGRKKNSVGKSSPGVIKQDISSSSAKPEISLKPVSSKSEEVNLPAKYASSPKKKLSSSDASLVLSGRSNDNIKIGKRTGTSKIAVKKAHVSPRASFSPRRSLAGVARGLASPRASSSDKPSLIRVASLNAKKNRGLKPVSSIKDQSNVKEIHVDQDPIKNVDPVQPTDKLEDSNNDMVQEKTLYIIKMEADNKYVESDQNEHVSVESSPPPISPPKSLTLSKSLPSSSHSEEDEVEDESDYTVTEGEDDTGSEYDETYYMEEVETLEGEHKVRYGKSGMVPSEDKDGEPVKLHFRRGRVIDIQSENSGPRRLKFRRGRMLGENQNPKADIRRSLNRRGADGDVTDRKPDSEKVVLRHQDVHGKKDAQGLFNNVIEETASKLVETRKSKVKALVGAFETVISLQDSNSAANTAS